MKTKPNFTYKEFIQKISNAHLFIKDKLKSKSPIALKTQNNNLPTTTPKHLDIQLQKKSTKKQQSLNKNITPKFSPNKISKWNQLQSDLMCHQNINNKQNTANKKLKLKNQLNAINQKASRVNLKHEKSQKQKTKQNLFHNYSRFEDQKHNHSQQAFFKSFNSENQWDDSPKNSISIRKNPFVTYNLDTKKLSSSNVESKHKLPNKGCITDRCMPRVSTQNDQEKKKIQNRMNTQYEREGFSPSFFKLSTDESSFLDCVDDKSQRLLFPQSSQRCKKSSISLYSQQQKVKMNENSYKHLYNKFIVKISSILYQITKIDDQGLLLQRKIKYIQYLECLKELKMIKSDYQPYSQTEGIDLVKELWEQIIMEHSINHFIIIIALILKITPLQHIRPENSAEIQNYVYIQAKYQQLRLTRLQLDKPKIYSQKQSIDYYNFPFKPAITKMSQQIDSKILRQSKHRINIFNNHNQSIQLNSKRQNASINTQFQHLIPISSLNLCSRSPLGNKRSEILYKEAKNKSLSKKTDKSTIQYEYERNKEELTFKPKITLKKKKKKNQQNIYEYVSPRFAQDEQKAINRLIQGRMEKQIKQQAIEKGHPYNQKIIERLKKEKFQEIIRNQQESRLKSYQNQSKIKLNIHKKLDDETKISHCQLSTTHRCTTQVEEFQSIHNLSFEDYSKRNQIEHTSNEQSLINKINSQGLTGNYFTDTLRNEPVVEANESFEDYFVLDIYFQQNRSDKLIIGRDWTIEEAIVQTQKFIQKHDLTIQMGQKLKKELMNTMKFHDIQKIEQNAEEDECSLLG